MGDLTILLRAAAAGDARAADQVLPLIYETLRQMAQQRMAREPSGHTLQPTALVHEAYLRLVKNKNARWENRRHFFGAASEAMRRILIERARRVRRLRHGGHLQRVSYDDAILSGQMRSERVLALDDSLARFEKHYPRKAQVIKLRFFVGLSISETAEVLEISEATVKEDWRFARAWLNRKTALSSSASKASKPSTERLTDGELDDA